jgi:hypothetical protein
VTDQDQSTARHGREHRRFSEGVEQPDTIPEDKDEGRFSRGQERVPDDEEKEREGRFSRGRELLPEDHPEKTVERRFSEGLEGRSEGRKRS